MLRASAHATDRAVDLRAISGGAADPLIDAGISLINYTTALIRGDPVELNIATSDLLDAAGPHAVIRAAAVAANFQMMNRLVDATGVPVGSSMRAIADELGVEHQPPGALPH